MVSSDTESRCLKAYRSSAFCGGPRYNEQFIWGLVPATKKRKIKLCGYPLILNNELRVHTSYLELEVEELSTPSAAARLLGLDISSPFYNALEDFLKCNFEYGTSDQILTGQYRRVERKVPRVSYRISEDSLRYLRDQLLKWNLEDLLFRYQHPPESHHGCLDSLPVAYAQRESPLSTVSQACIFRSVLTLTVGTRKSLSPLLL